MITNIYEVSWIFEVNYSRFLVAHFIILKCGRLSFTILILYASVGTKIYANCEHSIYNAHMDIVDTF